MYYVESRQHLLHFIWHAVIKTCYFGLVLLILLLSSQAKGQGIEAPKINLNLQDVSIKEAFTAIQKQSNIKFVYGEDVNKYSSTKVTIIESSISMEDAVALVLKGTGLRYTRKQSYILIDEKPVAPQSKKVPQTGTLSGVVLDETNIGLPGATIFVKELQTGATTDQEGNFSLLITPGSYTVLVSFVSYQKEEFNQVIIESGKTTPLVVKLKQATEDIEEVRVTAEYKRETVNALYAKQKKSVVLGNGISAEQISVLPDNNLGQVLKRVTGLTVQDNKFVTVRGMSERYNNVMLNGALMPSTEPNRRNFSFDIIPSNLVDNVVVAKTFSPELPAEFAGGIVQISTIDIPNKFFVSLSAGTGINTNSTGKNFSNGKRYLSDYFGGGDDHVWMNNGFDVEGFFSVYNVRKIENGNRDAYAALSPYMVKIPNNWGLYNYRAQPQQSYSFSMGKPLTLNEHSIGVVAAFTYRHEEKTENYEAMLRDKREYVTNNGKAYNFTTSIGGLANMAWKYKNHKIAWRNLYNRRFNNSSNEYDMRNENFIKGRNDINGINYEYHNSVLITTMWQNRIEGNHSFFNKHVNFNWFADKNQLRREQPDDRFSLAQYDSTQVGRGILSYDKTSPQPSSGGYLMATLYDETKSNLGVNIELNATIGGREQKLKFGYMGTTRDAESQLLGLKIMTTNVFGAYGAPDYLAFKTENFTHYRFYYQSMYSEKYAGEQHVDAGFAMIDISPLKSLKLTGGVRYEQSETDVITRIRSVTPRMVWVDSTITYPETDWLPSVTTIFSVTEKISLRASYSKTVTRPDFRERSAVSYYDVNEKANIAGNRGLVRSFSDNYDVRAEWYPAPGEVLSAGVFYKKFIHPAEMVAIYNPAGGYLFFYFNIDEATTQGMEFELRKSLGFIAPASKILSKIYITGNAIFMKGDVTYDSYQLLFQSGIYKDNDTMRVDSYRSRTLQGLAPYVINAGIGYNGKKLGCNISYNRSGDILMLAGTSIEYDEYELGRNVIDLQLSYKFLKEKMQLKFNVSDLLAEPFVRYRNTYPENVLTKYDIDPKGLDYNPDWDWTLRKSRKGRSFSVSLSYKL